MLPISLDGVGHLNTAKQRLDLSVVNRKNTWKLHVQNFIMQPFLPSKEQKGGGDCGPFMGLRKVSHVALIVLEGLSERLDVP